MQKIVVFDFDGTLITTNSFQLWVKFLLKQSILKARPVIFLRIVKLVFFRKIIKKIAHQHFKQRLMQLSIPEGWNRQFAETLSVHVVSEALVELEKRINEESVVIISSAAPESYLGLFIEKLIPGKTSNVVTIGSKLNNASINDNYKDQKLTNLYNLGLLTESQLIDELYTDSYDDKPLALAARSVILVLPKPHDVQLFQSSKIDYSILVPRP